MVLFWHKILGPQRVYFDMLAYFGLFDAFDAFADFVAC